MRAILMKIKFMVHFHDSIGRCYPMMQKFWVRVISIEIWQMLSDEFCDLNENKTNRVFFHDSIWQMLSDDAEIL